MWLHENLKLYMWLILGNVYVNYTVLLSPWPLGDYKILQLEFLLLFTAYFHNYRYSKAFPKIREGPSKNQIRGNFLNMLSACFGNVPLNVFHCKWAEILNLNSSVLWSSSVSLSLLTRFGFLPDLIHKRARGSSPLWAFKWNEKDFSHHSSRPENCSSDSPQKSPKTSFFALASIPTEKPETLNKYKCFLKRIIANID